ncbi:MAG: hypothetical protein RIE08_08975 [Acidimicrobiales bacterium]
MNDTELGGLEIQFFDPERDRLICELDYGLWAPEVWRMISTGSGRYRFPGPPGSLDAAVAWYGPITSILVVSLGWSDPGTGLKVWYDQGRPDWDIRFQVLNRLWGDRLDYYAAWLWKFGAEYLAGKPWLDGSLTERVDVDQRWLRGVEERAQRESHTPLLGGSDALHLSMHLLDPPNGFPGDPSSGSPGLVIGESSKRTMVFFARSLRTVLEGMDAVRSEMPKRSDGRSWRVHVVAEDVGRLGEFRLSRESGRWFSGRHRYHQMGITNVDHA